MLAFHLSQSTYHVNTTHSITNVPTEFSSFRHDFDTTGSLYDFAGTILRLRGRRAKKCFHVRYTSVFIIPFSHGQRTRNTILRKISISETVFWCNFYQCVYFVSKRPLLSLRVRIQPTLRSWEHGRVRNYTYDYIMSMHPELRYTYVVKKCINNIAEQYWFVAHGNTVPSFNVTIVFHRENVYVPIWRTLPYVYIEW